MADGHATSRVRSGTLPRVLESLLRFLLADINLWAPVAALVCGTVATRPPRDRRGWCAATLVWFCFWVLGIYGIHGFVLHFFFPGMTARLIGWPDSPFQYEVAYANLVFGVLGIAAFLKPERAFLRASILGFLVWFGCDGLGHVWSLFAQGDTAPYNAGSILWTDLLLPIAGVALYLGSAPAAAHPSGASAARAESRRNSP